ncbi:23S rRNA (pseudouridine(1915)-N(3))-methyltransferase RlmH [Ignavigranum ruoffiae]
MNIEIIVVGKLKEKYLKMGIAEYLKRLQSYAKCKIIEVADEATEGNLTETQEALILQKEADRIQAHLKADRKLWILAIEGELMSSEEIAQTMEDYATYGQSKLTIVIGGSLGIAQSIKDQADLLLSFGRITYPHQLMRLVLVEQIYRAFRIIHHQPYHK